MISGIWTNQSGLLQVGHEPLPPTLGRNLFGRQVYQLPGLFAYGKAQGNYHTPLHIRTFSEMGMPALCS